MEKVGIVAALFFSIVWLKILINNFHVMHLQRLLRMYRCYDGTTKYDRKLAEKTDEIVSMFKRAKIEEPVIPYTRVSTWLNLHLDTEIIVELNLVSFYKAIGYYKHRRNEAFSPLYWIDFVLYSPRNLLTYIGFDANTALVKAIQGFMWLLGGAAALTAIILFFER